MTVSDNGTTGVLEVNPPAQEPNEPQIDTSPIPPLFRDEFYDNPLDSDPHPQEIYRLLPAPLAELTAYYEEPWQKVFFLNDVLPVLGGQLPNVIGEYYDEEYSSDVYVMLVARSGVGKKTSRKPSSWE